MMIKLRVVQEVYFDHQRRRPGDVLDVGRADCLNDFGEFECPRWAVIFEDKVLPGANPRRDR